MNVIQARLVVESSFSCSDLKIHIGPLKHNSYLKPKVRLRRLAVPGLHGDISNCCDWRCKRVEWLIPQDKSCSLTNPHIRRNPDCWQSAGAGSILVRASGLALKASGSSTLAVSMSVVDQQSEVEYSGLANSHATGRGREDEEESICEREKLRRQRISKANKGRVPWNKGGKHSPETIERIRRNTYQAMQSPKVLAKLRLNPRHPQSDATRVKIGHKLKENWELKKKIRGYHDVMLKEWRMSVAGAARKGGLGEEELQWNSYGVIKKMLIAAAVALSRAERQKKRAERAKERTRDRSPTKSEEHRLKISAAIRAKWEDPEYQKRVREGMSKNEGLRPRRSSSPKQVSPKAASVKSGVGFVNSPQDKSFIAAVMSDEKKKSRQKELANNHRDGDALSVAPRKARGLLNRKVNLLRRNIIPDKSISDNITEVGMIGGRSDPAEHSSEDSLVSEKLLKLKLLKGRWFLMDQRRREAAERARMLIAKAETAAKVIEETFGNEEFAMASLAETRKLMAEAEQFMRTAENFNSAASHVDGNGSYDGAMFQNAIPSHQPPNSHLQMESQENQVSIEMKDDHLILQSNFTTVSIDKYLQMGQDPVVEINSVTSNVVPGTARDRMFGSEVMGKTQIPFTEDSTDNMFPSLGLLNGVLPGRAARAIIERWQHPIHMEDENHG